MTQYEVIIEEPAQISIERNAKWWAENHSVEQAIKWQTQIYDQMREGLCVMPERHGFARENDAFEVELRQQLLGTGGRPGYRALFTIRQEAVHVLAFLACEQDDLDPAELQ